MIVSFWKNFCFQLLSNAMALSASKSVMPSKGLVRMKCGNWESSITYSSSMMTYRASWAAFSNSQNSISMPLLCLESRLLSLGPMVDDQLALTTDGVMSITRPGRCRVAHMSCIASRPRYFHEDTITISTWVASMIRFNYSTAWGSKMDPCSSRHGSPFEISKSW